MLRNSLLPLLLSSFFIFFIDNAFCQEGDLLFSEGRAMLADGKKSKAIKKFEESLLQAKTENNTTLQMQCHFQLADLKNTLVKHKEALEHYREFSELYKKQSSYKARILEKSVVSLKSEVIEGTEIIKKGEEEILKGKTEIVSKDLKIDSLTNAQYKAKLAILNLELDNQKKELDIQSANSRQNMWIMISIICVLLVVFALIGFFQKRKVSRDLSKKNQRIILEKQRSEELLLNILPKAIAEELKLNGKTTSAYFDMATVMFTDFKGFTQFSECHTPNELVEFIDYYFREFDHIMAKYNIEKIKTIGDAYMCVSGIPIFNKSHAQNMVCAALEIQEFVRKTKVERQLEGGDYLDLRIGIHAGPLVAGVVGEQKFAYDVWGDTVNIAARMEQSGVPGAVNVSEVVYSMVNDDFQFDFRGEVDVKNKGKMKMYLLKDSLIKNVSLRILPNMKQKESA